MRRSLNLRIASPCRVAWDEMQGTARARHCSLCDKQVFNISELTRDEAEALIIAHGGKVCVTYYQRSDGTIMLADCTYHEQRGGWLPAIAAGAMFGAAVLATPPAAEATDELVMYSGGLGELPDNDWAQRIPVVAIDAKGDIVYQGERLTTVDMIQREPAMSRLDVLHERLVATPLIELERRIVVYAHAATDMRVVNLVVSTIERAGYFALYAEKQ